MTRLEKLAAVAEAALPLAWRSEKLKAALAALDTPDAEAETVTLEAWSHSDGDIVLVVPGSVLAREYPCNDYRRRLGTVTLPLVKERGA